VKVLQSLDKNSFAKLKKIAKVPRKVATAITTPVLPGLEKAPLKKDPRIFKRLPIFAPLRKKPLSG
jgi:hypothetical protein